ncbi:MAG: thiol:disulfide interchange protein DsbA/DsbL [Betaproteobacteria bacterium]|nr:thiol:disulfide interchange protein DsbA/DsbL [Betaproteobacteria bacterium]
MRATRLCIRRSLLCGLALLAFALPGAAQQVKRDIDYRLLPQPQPVQTGERIEVIDFFFYACPYCNELAPHLDRWIKRKPADVVFRRMPVVRHDTWVPLAKTYFALEAMGEVERLHMAVYRSYHVDDLYMSQEKVIAEWATKNGLDSEKFMSIYRSDEVKAKVELAKKMTKDYDIQGTPSVVVDGKFLTSSSMTPGVAQVIPVIDGLVRLARQQRIEKSGK